MLESKAANEMEAAPDLQREPRTLHVIGKGLVFYYVTTAFVFCAVVFSVDYVRLCLRHSMASRRGLIASCAAWDGHWYSEIVRDGYSFNIANKSNVAFYPAFPMVAWVVRAVTGVQPETALLFVSNLFLLAAFCVFAIYVRERRKGVPWKSRDDRVLDYTLLAFGLSPVSFFFRMAYSESMCVFLMILTLYGFLRRWNVVSLAMLIGLCTATRSVGAALLVPFVVHLWQESTSCGHWVRRCVVFVPLACWGVASYMAYQHTTFGDAFAFVKAQEFWKCAYTDLPVSTRIMRILTLAPIRAVFDRSSPCYWVRQAQQGNAIFSVTLANPAILVVSASLIVIGARARVLLLAESLLGACLLLIPYCAHADTACCAGEARYAGVVFPVYIVVGEMLQRLPGPVAALFVSWAACLLAAYTALFVSWYWVY